MRGGRRKIEKKKRFQFWFERNKKKKKLEGGDVYYEPGLEDTEKGFLSHILFKENTFFRIFNQRKKEKEINSPFVASFPYFGENIPELEHIQFTISDADNFSTYRNLWLPWKL